MLGRWASRVSFPGYDYLTIQAVEVGGRLGEAREERSRMKRPSRTKRRTVHAWQRVWGKPRAFAYCCCSACGSLRRVRWCE